MQITKVGTKEKIHRMSFRPENQDDELFLTWVKAYCEQNCTKFAPDLGYLLKNRQNSTELAQIKPK